MTRLICVTSGKGGVGKTTVVTNLASALTDLGHDVIAVDANLTTPNLGLHLGMHLAPKTLHDVLKGNARLSSAIYYHQFGFKILPASMSVRDLQNVDIAKLQSVALGLYGKADFVLMDSAAGLGREAISAINASDEVIVVTNPDLPSLADALKTIKITEKSNKKILGVVVNRVRDKWYETTKNEAEQMLGYPILAEIPEDKNVLKSLALKMPVVHYDNNSPASHEFKRVAHMLVGKQYRYTRKTSFRILNKLVGWMSR